MHPGNSDIELTIMQKRESWELRELNQQMITW